MSGNIEVDAFLFCAGLGTRLRPITNSIPKPLVKVHGKPLIEYQLDWLVELGFNRVIINTYHLKELFHKYTTGYKGLEIILVEEIEILGHSGGMKNAEGFIQEDLIFALNGDTILRFDANELKREIDYMNEHPKTYMHIWGFEHKNPLIVGRDGVLKGIGSKLLGGKKSEAEDYHTDSIGASLIRRGSLELLRPDEGFMGFYGNDDLVERIISSGRNVTVNVLDKYVRYEVTTPDDLCKINTHVLDLKI